MVLNGLSLSFLLSYLLRFFRYLRLKSLLGFPLWVNVGASSLFNLFLGCSCGDSLGLNSFDRIFLFWAICRLLTLLFFFFLKNLSAF